MAAKWTKRSVAGRSRPGIPAAPQRSRPRGFQRLEDRLALTAVFQSAYSPASVDSLNPLSESLESQQLSSVVSGSQTIENGQSEFETLSHSARVSVQFNQQAFSNDPRYNTAHSAHGSPSPATSAQVGLNRSLQVEVREDFVEFVLPPMSSSTFVEIANSVYSAPQDLNLVVGETLDQGSNTSGSGTGDSFVGSFFVVGATPKEIARVNELLYREVARALQVRAPQSYQVYQSQQFAHSSVDESSVYTVAQVISSNGAGGATEPDHSDTLLEFSDNSESYAAPDSGRSDDSLSDMLTGAENSTAQLSSGGLDFDASPVLDSTSEADASAVDSSSDLDSAFSDTFSAADFQSLDFASDLLSDDASLFSDGVESSSDQFVDITQLETGDWQEVSDADVARVDQKVVDLLQELHTPPVQSVGDELPELPQLADVPAETQQALPTDGGMVLLESTPDSGDSDLLPVDQAFADLGEFTEVDLRMEPVLGAYQAFDMGIAALPPEATASAVSVTQTGVKRARNEQSEEKTAKETRLSGRTATILFASGAIVANYTSHLSRKKLEKQEPRS